MIQSGPDYEPDRRDCQSARADCQSDRREGSPRRVAWSPMLDTTGGTCSRLISVLRHSAPMAGLRRLKRGVLLRASLRRAGRPSARPSPRLEPWAFAAYVAALDAEEAAASDLAGLHIIYARLPEAQAQLGTSSPPLFRSDSRRAQLHSRGRTFVGRATGLSTQIRRLEAELGVLVCSTATRGGVNLTDAGVLFLERARAALAAADIAGATGRDLGTGRRRIGEAWTSPNDSTWGLSRLVTCSSASPGSESGVEVTVLEGYGGTLWRDLRNGRLDALLAPAPFSSGDLRRIGPEAPQGRARGETSHPLAGIGPLSADHLHGQRVAVTGHRDGAGYDRAITEMFGRFRRHRGPVPGSAGARTARFRGGRGRDRADYGPAEPPSGCHGPPTRSASHAAVQPPVARRDPVGCA